MKTQIDEIQSMFAFYGFTSCPLTRKHIARLIVRGFSTDDIYGIGCDVNSGIYSTK